MGLETDSRKKNQEHGPGQANKNGFFPDSLDDKEF